MIQSPVKFYKMVYRESWPDDSESRRDNKMVFSETCLDDLDIPGKTNIDCLPVGDWVYRVKKANTKALDLLYSPRMHELHRFLVTTSKLGSRTKVITNEFA